MDNLIPKDIGKSDTSTIEPLEPDCSSAKTSYQTLANHISNTLPSNVETVVGRIGQCSGLLFNEELNYVCNAVYKRQLEFITGRVCSRLALERLSVASCAIPVGPMREPIWPEGIVGSITHDGAYCAVAVVNRENIPLLGIDLIASRPLEPNLADLICTEQDISNNERLINRKVNFDPYKLTFCIKESIYKCLFPVVQTIFDFQDVSIAIQPESNSAKVTLENERLFSGLGTELNVKFCLADSYLFSAVWAE